MHPVFVVLMAPIRHFDNNVGTFSKRMFKHVVKFVLLRTCAATIEPLDLDIGLLATEQAWLELVADFSSEICNVFLRGISIPYMTGQRNY